MTDRLKRLTAEIVAHYVEANKIGASELPELIQSTFAALGAAERPVVEDPAPIAKPTAAQIRKSITPDALISFVDGRPYRMLKRHLAKAGLTPAQYRARYDLPANYPITAASYSAKRSALARSTGLGRKNTSEALKASLASEPMTAEIDMAASAGANTPAGEKAGPGARVAKAVRSVKRTPASDES